MGDIGSAIAGGFNSFASVYQANKYREGVHETNETNIMMNRENNNFSDYQATKAYERQQDLQGREFNFNANQADLNRDFQSSEADKARQWQEDFYKENESPEALARQYQALGINPAGVLSGSGGSVASTSIPSGSQASGSAGSAPQASASSFAGAQAPAQTDNPISAFLSAFQSAQRTEAEVQSSRLNQEYQKIQNRYATDERIASIEKAIAEKKKALSSSDVDLADKKKIETEIQQMEFRLGIDKELREDLIALTKQERLEKEETVKGLILDNARKDVENKWLPTLMSDQHNLSQSQAYAVVKSADAAMADAISGRVNSETGRMQILFDVKKYVETFKNNIEANTRLTNAAAEGQENENRTFTGRMIYDMTNQSLGHIEKLLMNCVMGAGLGKLAIKNVPKGYQMGSSSTTTSGQSVFYNP